MIFVSTHAEYILKIATILWNLHDAEIHFILLGCIMLLPNILQLYLVRKMCM